jgi:hypothetical protein
MSSRTESILLVRFIAAVFLLEALLWLKFRRDWRGKRVLIGVARFVVVIAAVLAYGVFGNAHAGMILIITMLAVVGISFIPILADKL